MLLDLLFKGTLWVVFFFVVVVFGKVSDYDITIFKVRLLLKGDTVVVILNTSFCTHSITIKLFWCLVS